MSFVTASGQNRNVRIRFAEIANQFRAGGCVAKIVKAEFKKGVAILVLAFGSALKLRRSG